MSKCIKLLELFKSLNKSLHVLINCKWINKIIFNLQQNAKISYFYGINKILNMRYSISSILLIVFLTIIVVACSNSKVNKTKQVESKKEEVNVPTKAGPQVIIYKTKADYFNNVPVTLSDDKSKIVSYPGIKDIFYKGDLAYPTKLNNGFLLDNRGIDNNTAFLKYTYEQYSKLEATPTSDELLANILDKDPIAEIYNCGSKYDYKDLVTELNKAIDDNNLTSFQKLK